MKEKKTTPPASIPSEAYTRDYFETCCQGYQEYTITAGKQLPLRLNIPLQLAQVKAGMRILDIGCGRGELVYHCALMGAQALGLDYAQDAVRLARQTLQASASLEIQAQIAIQQANACVLPLRSNHFDRVFMLDIIEHLYPPELKQALDEVWRILRPGGKLIVHTMPCLWYYRFGYPLYRILQAARGEKLPSNPRFRYPYQHVHVNEQTPRTLNRALKDRRFKTKVWLASTQSYEYEANSLVRNGMYFLTRLWPFRLIFSNDIFAIAIKE